jgi:hypothetical protein
MQDKSPPTQAQSETETDRQREEDHQSHHLLRRPSSQSPTGGFPRSTPTALGNSSRTFPPPSPKKNAAEPSSASKPALPAPNNKANRQGGFRPASVTMTTAHSAGSHKNSQGPRPPAVVFRGRSRRQARECRARNRPLTSPRE